MTEVIRRLFNRLRARLTPDTAADFIKRDIAEAKARHAPTRNLQAALRDLRHSQLGGSR